MDTTFETLNYEFEAKRIARSFGVASPIRFWFDAPRDSIHPDADEFKKLIVHPKFDPLPYVWLEDDLELVVTYYQDRKVFKMDGGLCSNHFVDESEEIVLISLGWDGSVLTCKHNSPYAIELARGLYHLGLLTPAVEEALHLTISEAQAKEWSSERLPKSFMGWLLMRE